MSAIKSKLLSIRSQMEDLNKQLQETGRIAFHEETKRLFEKYPELQSFSWTQYTPYFNDGDECVFRCGGADNIVVNYYGPDATADGEDDDGDGRYDKQHSFYSWDDKVDLTPKPDEPWDKQAAWEITRLIKDIGDPTMKDIFGDHSEVIVGRNKVLVEHYDHD